MEGALTKAKKKQAAKKEAAVSEIGLYFSSEDKSHLSDEFAWRAGDNTTHGKVKSTSTWNFCTCTEYDTQ